MIGFLLVCVLGLSHQSWSLPLSSFHLNVTTQRHQENLQSNLGCPSRADISARIKSMSQYHEKLQTVPPTFLTHTYADFSRLNLSKGGDYCRYAVYTLVLHVPIETIYPPTVGLMCWSPSTHQVYAHASGFGQAYWDDDGAWYSWPEAGLPCVQNPIRTYSNYEVLLNQLINVDVGRGFGANITQRRYTYNNLVLDFQFGPAPGSELITTDKFGRWLTYAISQTTGPTAPVPKFSAIFQFDDDTTFAPTPGLLNRPSICNSSVPLYDNVYFPEPPLNCSALIADK
jgi:hypothetical protein